ncbi:MAG: EamA family transporter [Betaproteobacteria bacterium]
MTDAGRLPRWLPVAGLLGCAVSLGSGHVCARLAFHHGVNLLTASTLRAGCASLVVGLLLLARGGARTLSRREFAGTVGLGVCVVGQTLLVQTAVKLLPVTLALLLFYTYPLFTAITAALLGDQHLTRRLTGALLAAFAGLGLVLGVSPAAVNPLGVASAIGAALVFTGTLTLTPRLAPAVAAPLRTFLMMSTATAIIGVTTVMSGNVEWPGSPIAWAGLAGLCVLYGLGIVGLFLLLPRMGPVQTAVVLNMEPVFVAFIAWATLGERLSAMQMAGAAIVVAAVMSTQIRRS